jgi:hypothetical protein
MGYEIRFSGEIRVDPPIPADAVTAAGFPEAGRYGGKDVAVKVVEVPVEGVPGAYRRLVAAIVPCMSVYTAYQIDEHIQQVVSRWGEGRTFSGRIDCVDPIEGDQWRLQVRDGRVVTVKPRIVWPDDEQAPQ